MDFRSRPLGRNAMMANAPKITISTTNSSIAENPRFLRKPSLVSLLLGTCDLYFNPILLLRTGRHHYFFVRRHVAVVVGKLVDGGL